MERAELRSLTSQLAEDLGWLEEHARKQTGQGAQAERLRLAAGMVRNVLGPWLENQGTMPLHLAVVGGAGAGKSSVANMLCGGPVAESNPQAGFTRHPTAYVGEATAGLPWADYLGFLGPLRRLTSSTPSNLDEDVYQVRRVTTESKDASLLENVIVWDCPDMTTTAATGYVSRLLEVASLADVVAYVASDERYNDEPPTWFFRMLLAAGKSVIVCLVKVRELDSAAFIDHFTKEVLAPFPLKPAAVLTIPQLTFEQLSAPVEKAGAYRERLMREVQALTQSIEAARRRNVRAALECLKEHSEDLQAVARRDLDALERWRNLVQDGQVEFEQRYRVEYLAKERLRRFDEAQFRLLDLLDMPGLGRVVSGVLYVMRVPYRFLRGMLAKTVQGVFATAVTERPVLEGALAGWLNQLRKEAARHTGEHPLWALVQQGFAHDLADEARERFEQGYRRFQVNLSSEIDGTARRIFEEVEQRPFLLTGLRWGKAALEVLSMVAVLYFYGIGLLDLIFLPLAVSLMDHLVELLVGAYVDMRRERARVRQQAMMTENIAAPLADWLTGWPATGGSIYERLHIALRRIDPAITQLDAAVGNV